MRTAIMSIGEIEKRAAFALKTIHDDEHKTHDDLCKIRVADRKTHVEVIFDAHGYTVHDAMVCMRNIINLIRCPFKLTVIHGYHGGQAIMTAIRTKSCSARISRMYTNYWNNGITHFWVDSDSYIQAYAA